MNIFKRIFKTFFLVVVPSLTGNSKETITNLEPDNFISSTKSTCKFIYRFEDAPVPPAYHRSYTISVTPEKIDFSIDSYGKILSKETLPITKRKYQSFETSMLQLHIKSREELKSKGCDGGTSDKLDLCTGENYEVKGYIYHCGGESFGNLEGDVSKAVELFKTIIPNLKKRINDSKK